MKFSLKLHRQCLGSKIFGQKKINYFLEAQKIETTNGNWKKKYRDS